jgi:hypothetical protein
MRMTEVGNKLYEVESESTADITYIVNTGAEVPTCTCTAFAIKRNKEKKLYGNPVGGWCKHLEAVIAEFGKKSRKAQEAEELEVEMAMSKIKLTHLLGELGGE